MALQWKEAHSVQRASAPFCAVRPVTPSSAQEPAALGAPVGHHGLLNHPGYMQQPCHSLACPQSCAHAAAAQQATVAHPTAASPTAPRAPSHGKRSVPCAPAPDVQSSENANTCPPDLPVVALARLPLTYGQQPLHALPTPSPTLRGPYMPRDMPRKPLHPPLPWPPGGTFKSP
jgi:hypothetical protein